MENAQILGLIALIVAIVLMGSGLILFMVYRKKLAEYNREQSDERFIGEEKK